MSSVNARLTAQGAGFIETMQKDMACFFDKVEQSKPVLSQTIQFAQFIQKLREAFSCSASSMRDESIAKRMNENLLDFRRNIQASGMMNSMLATPVYMSSMIANLLVNEDGSLNMGWIPTILHVLNTDPLFAEGEKCPPCIQRMKEILQRFMLDETLIKIINEIDAEEIKEIPERGRQMITGVLNLPFETDITPAMQKKALIASILAMPYQFETNDCQALWSQIAFDAFRPEYTLKDYKDLILFALVKRVFQGQQANLSFPPYMACDTLRAPITIDRSGGIYPAISSDQSLITFWQAIPMQSALNQMSLSCNNGELNEDVLELLFKGKEGEQIQVTPLEIIAAYAKAGIDEGDETRQEQRLLERGCYGFAAVRNPPVQRALSSSVMFASQYTDGPSSLNWMVECVENTFKKKMTELQPPLKGWGEWACSFVTYPYSNEVNAMIGLVSKKLKEITRIQYEQRQVWDGRGDYGQNVPYMINRATPDEIGERMGSKEAFQTLLQQAIEDVQSEIKNQHSKDKNYKCVALAILENMSREVGTAEFIKTACDDFSSHYGDPATYPAVSQNVPWRFFKTPFGRSDSWVYLGEGPNPEVHTQIDGSKGIDQVVEWWMEQVADIDNMVLDPKENPIAYNGVVFAPWFDHSFNWWIYNDRLIEMKEMMNNQNCTWQEALNTMVVQPGNQVADTPVSNPEELLGKLKVIVADAANLQVDPYKAVPTENSKGIPLTTYPDYLNRLRKTVALSMNLEQFNKQWMQEIEAKGNLTIYQISQMIIRDLNKAFNPLGNPTAKEVINEFVGLVVVENLSEENYETLADSAIPIANANWVGTKYSEVWPRSMYFCYFQNPATKQLSIGIMTDNKKGLIPLPLTNTIGAYRVNLRTVPDPLRVLPVKV